MATITKGSTLKATSIGDSKCVWTASVLERKGNFVIALINGEIILKKVKSFNGVEYCMLMGNYSMAPTFKLA